MPSNRFNLLRRIGRAQGDDWKRAAALSRSYFLDDLQPIVLREVQVQNENVRSRNRRIAIEFANKIKGQAAIFNAGKLVRDRVGPQRFLDEHRIGIVILGEKNPDRRTG